MIHPKNMLNELTNREWMIETKSVWFSQPPKRDKLKAKHPATFAESDIIRLIEFFTKPGEVVFDPFLGSGSTLVACSQCGRNGVGVELIEEWAKIASERLEGDLFGTTQSVVQGDAREVIVDTPESTYDFIVTSPPYWMILRKDKDHKAKAERIAKGLDTRYSDEVADLGNIKDYPEFLVELGAIFGQCARVLKKRKYMAVVVSDFRHNSKFVAYHSDICQLVESCGLHLEGITILAQDSKNLYPYGMPYAYVSNIHHQYILIFRKR